MEAGVERKKYLYLEIQRKHRARDWAHLIYSVLQTQSQGAHAWVPLPISDSKWSHGVRVLRNYGSYGGDGDLKRFRWVVRNSWEVWRWLERRES